MNDRELLELAAKAAGIEVRFCKTVSADYRTGLGDLPYMRKPRQPAGWDKRHEDWCEPWSPLTDDGDALRLAVRLGEKYPVAVVGIFNRAAIPHAAASVVHRDGSETYIEQEAGDDLLAATRRAIVRAAAAIGGSRP